MDIFDIRNNKSNNLYFYGALIYAFLIPFHQKWATIAIILWAITSLISFKKSNFTKGGYLILLPVTYLLYFMEVFTSKNPSFSFLELKLSFLIFPLIFSLNEYSKKQREDIMRVFVLGLLGSALICLGAALYHSIHFINGTFSFSANVLDGKGFVESILYGGNYFFGTYLSIFHQTVYSALYICVGVTIVLFRPCLFRPKRRIGILCFFIAFIFLISNKASFIAIGLIFTIYLLHSQLNFKKKGIGISVVLGAMILLAFTNPRAKESVKKVVNGELELNKDARYGFSTRLLSWDAALTLIKANPILGYGAGDTQRKLNRMYAQKEYIFPLKESYNAHNQWLQTWMENGLLGVLAMTCIFVVLFKIALNRKENVGFILSVVIILLVNSMFESIFNRFSGVSFFSFFVCFIFSWPKRKKIRE